ncbi:aldo/keto reductase [Patescibacteria group bacterium]|nr:aldo/keto reductase [Patescibacteria group bacterium]
MKRIYLNEQASIPILGFGTWQLAGEAARKPLEVALSVGYRHFDTAAAYDNHEVLGEVLKRSGLKREELFVTSKIWRDDLKARDVVAACEEALEELQMPYIDLYLIHWPNREIPIGETLEAMGKLKEDGLIKAIGVSNFTIRHLEEAMKTGIEISNNQVELHPSFNQNELESYCDRHHISLTAYSPVGQGQDLKLPKVQTLAKKYSRSESEIILAWLRQKNIIAIPRSKDPDHILENFKSLDFDLETADLQLMEDIPQERRMINPSFAEFAE